METVRLYVEDPHLHEFEATVLACQPGKHGYDVILDRSAFYPEGGGQPGDTGTLSGVAVTDTHEVDGQLVHYCEGPLEARQTVEGRLDWQRRFSHMQLHSGEHILSGLIHQTYGYENVGFHMGAAMTTIDFSGMLTWEQLKDLERRANQIIWQNLPVEVSYPDRETLSATPYRSKKELTGQVRLVTVPGVDICACCGTHVTSTGEIGLIKIFSCQKFHQGVRLEILCGGPAYDHTVLLLEQNRQNSALLSAQATQTAAATEKLLEAYGQSKFRAGQLERQYAALKAAGYENAGNVLVFEAGFSGDGLRQLTSQIAAACGGRCAVFSGSDQAGYAYCISQEGGDLRAFTKEMNTALQGRGGGKPNFVQGSVRAAQAAIEAWFFQEAQK